MSSLMLESSTSANCVLKLSPWHVIADKLHQFAIIIARFANATIGSLHSICLGLYLYSYLAALCNLICPHPTCESDWSNGIRGNDEPGPYGLVEAMSNNLAEPPVLKKEKKLFHLADWNVRTSRDEGRKHGHAKASEIRTVPPRCVSQTVDTELFLYLKPSPYAICTTAVCQATVANRGSPSPSPRPPIYRCFWGNSYNHDSHKWDSMGVCEP